MKKTFLGLALLAIGAALLIASSANAATKSSTPEQVMQELTQTLYLPAPDTNSTMKSAILDSDTQSATYRCKKKSSKEVKSYRYFVHGGANYVYCDNSKKSMAHKVVGVNFSTTVKSIGADLLQQKLGSEAKAGASQRISATKSNVKVTYSCMNRSRDSVKTLTFTKYSNKTTKCPKSTTNSTSGLRKNS